MKQDFAMSDIRIRLVRKEDYPLVENMIREAFWNVNVPGASEHYLAHLLRDDPDFIPELDFVAEIEEFDKRFPKKEKKVLPQKKEFFINSHSVVDL